MELNKYETFVHGNYSYKNFLNLSKDELLTILEWRNHPDIRKHMNNTQPISVDSHLNFVESLSNRNDVCYWLISAGEKNIGVLNIIDIDFNTKTCEPGFYLSPEVMGKGESIFLLHNYKSLLFNKLGFTTLIGHNYLDNLPALQFTLFFGAKVTGTINVNGRKNIQSILNRDSFNKLGNKGLISQYVKFVKNWDINSISGLENL